MVHLSVDVGVATISCIVAVNYRFVFPHGSKDAIIGKRFKGVEIKHKHQVASHKGKHLVVVLVPEFANGEFLESVHTAQQVHHIHVPIVEELVFQIFAVHQVPLPAGIFVAPAIAFTGEVDPFRVSPFISHKIEVTAIDGGSRYEANHFVESHTPVHGGVVVVDHHVPIHFLIDEAENDGFVAHERLVVAFCVADGFFVGTSVGEFPVHRSGFPIFILLLLDGFNPIVGYAHSHTVVETDAAIFKWPRQSRHTAHFLSDRDGMGVHLVDEHIGEG